MADIKIVTVVDANNPILGDLYLENGTVRLTQTLAEEVTQRLMIKFRFFLGEWFLDPTKGLPYQQTIFQKAPLPILGSIFRRLISTDRGVKALLEFTITRSSSRVLVVRFRAQLIDDTTLVFPPPSNSNYSPANPFMWALPLPTTEVEALARIASVLYFVTLDQTDIPVASPYVWANPQPAEQGNMIDRLASVAYNLALDENVIPYSNMFTWAAPPPNNIQEQIDRLASVEYTNVLDSNPIP